VNVSNLTALLRYQVVDVLLLAEVMGELQTRWAATMTPEESEVLRVSRAIDHRGARFDAQLAQRVCDVEAEMRDVVAGELYAELAQALGVSGPGGVREVLRSPKRVAEVLSEVFGVSVPNTQRGTLTELVEAEEVAGVGALFVQARIDEVRVTSAKLARGIELVGADSRIAGTLRYYGAHTGRWSSQRVQLHNLPRGVSAPSVPELVAAVEEGAGALRELCAAYEVRVSDALATLVRACFVGDPLTVADLSNIEARVLPWLAGDAEGLAVFQRGGDPYVAFARKIWPGAWKVDTEGETPDAVAQYKLRRAIGKVGVLASGYGAGAKRIGAFAAGYGVDLAKANLTPADLCEGWRDANPLIAGERTGREYQGVACREGGYWRRLERAFKDMAEGAPAREVGAVAIQRRGDDVLAYLPSGRALVYHRLRMEDRPRFGEVKPGLCYTQRRGRAAVTVDLYGGKLCENLTQAAARDFFAWGMVLLERRGLRPVLHVHDEMICETGDVDAVLAAMTERPAWAPDFPLGAEGFTCTRYAKSPPPGVDEVKRESG
jgi:DNA polymerase